MDKAQQEINYQRIEKAIRYILQRIKDRPTLEEIAEHVHLSPFHFQRLFTAWAGTSPKKFMQYLQVSYAKKLLKDEQKTLFDTHLDLGMSSTSRLHHLFVEIEGMTPAEYKQGGHNLTIRYNFYETPFGSCLIGSTDKGICCLSFVNDEKQALAELKNNFPLATYKAEHCPLHQDALAIFSQTENLPELKLHLKGTPFQLKVWEALLRIPKGRLSTYGQLAKDIAQPKASRAVGTAIGSNPIAFLIPCHRVIQSTGTFGGYMWDPVRKDAMIAWEQAQTNSDHEVI